MIPQAGLVNRGADANGETRGSVIVRGVVIGTYFADQETRSSFAADAPETGAVFVPGTGSQTQFTPKAVACDVLTYGGRFRNFLPRVPVAQVRHGLNDHASLWIPRPTTMNLTTGQAPVLSRTGNTPAEDPRDYDGDHVIVQFFENDPQQPFIYGSLPHPRTTYRQLAADGETRRSRHRGVVASIDKDGNILVDTTRANSGAIVTGQSAIEKNLPDGEEPAVNDDGHGNLTVRMNHAASLTVIGLNDAGVEEKFALAMSDGQFSIRLSDGESITLVGKDGDATFKIGNGAVHAAIAEHLRTFWDSAFKAAYDAHLHPEAALRASIGAAGLALTTAGADPVLAAAASVAAVAIGTAGAALTAASLTAPDPPAVPAPAYDTAITSGKLSLPDG